MRGSKLLTGVSLRQLILAGVLLAGVPVAFLRDGAGTACLAAQEAQTLLDLDDPRVTRIEELARLRGMVHALPVKPWTLRQARRILERLDSVPAMDGFWESLGGRDGDMGAELRSLRNALSGDLKDPVMLSGDSGAFDPGLESTLAGRLHSGPENDGESTLWTDSWHDRLPWLGLTFTALWGPKEEGDETEAPLFQGFWGSMDWDLKEDPNLLHAWFADQPADITNWPENLAFGDWTMPHRALASAGGDFWNLSLGRGRMDLGNGRTGNLLVSDTPDWWDYLRLQLQNDWITYTGLWVHLDGDLRAVPYELWPEVDGVTWDDTTSKDDWSSRSWEDARNLFLHRYDIDVMDSVHVGVFESALVGGVQPTLEYVNPFMFLHDFYPWKDSKGDGFFCASTGMGVELTVAPVRGVQLWGQFASNQITTPLESANWAAADAEASAVSFLAGASGTFVIPGGGEIPGRGPWVMEAGCEGVYVNPWMYVRETALTSWIWWRRTMSAISGASQWEVLPMGWRLGPDSLSANLWFQARRAGFVDARLGLEWRAQGENSLLSVYQQGPAALGMVTPTGTPVYTWICKLSTAWPLREATRGTDGEGYWDMVPSIDLRATLAWVAVDNFNHDEGISRSEVQAELGLTFRW